MRRSLTIVLALVAVLGAFARGQAHAANIFVISDITVSETWTSNNEYILTKPIYVTSGATLTIEPGTVVRGEPTSGANDPGTLIVTRGSKLRAIGTAVKPIVFTNLDDDNIGSNPGTFPYDVAENALGTTGTWGGLILLGRSYVANNTAAAPSAAREVQIEGLTASGGLGFYGNCAASPQFPNCDDDDSGTIQYLSIRYGGFNLSANNEINGLTLGAVGRETDISNVEVFQNKDDGIECFGGTVNLKNIVIGPTGDDMLDYDEGYRGKVQFLFAMQGTPGSDKSDKGGEHDGGNAPDESQPRSIPTIYNATYVGQGQKSYTGKLTNTALHFRDNAGGRYYNSYFADFGGATMLIEGTSTSCSGVNSSGERYQTAYTVDGTFYRDPPSAFQLELQDNTFWCFGAANDIPGGQCSVSLVDCCSNADCVGGGGDSCVDQAPTYGGDAGKIHRNADAFTTAALDNTYLSCASALPIRTLTRTPIGNPAVPDPITSIDPRPTTASPLLTTNRTPPADGFFTPAPYRGAFGTTNWAAGWTAMARLGYFPPTPQQPVTADITVSATWSPENEYILTKPIYVTSGATLTIEPGTVVRGEPTSGANDPGTLIVTRGSKLQAVGTEDQPIVFTNLDDDNIGSNPGTFPYDVAENALGTTGTWGGLILLGRSYVANNTAAAPSAAREVQIEGLTASGGLGFYGNCAASPQFPNCDDDDSGTIQYLSIRYGGFNLSANNEINGLTLGAVGRETDISNVEVFQNKDDGIECFGGTVNLKNIVIGPTGDDMLDYDEGYRGKVQFLFAMQGTPGSDKSDKGGEHDGGNAPDESQPRSIPTIYNATYVGQGQKSYTGKLTNTALHFRDNAGGRYYNSYFADFGGATMLIEGTSTSCSGVNSSGERYQTAYTVDGTFYRDPPSAFQLELQDNTFWCFGAANDIPGGQCSVSLVDCCSNADCVGGGGDTCVDQAPTYGGDTGKIHRNADVFTTAALDNTYLSCASALPIRTLTRTPIGNPAVPDPITSIDPRPAAGSPLGTTNRKPPVSGFFTPATHRGAFSGSNWAGSWTNMARLGYFPSCLDASSAVPDEVRDLRFPTKTTFSWTAPALTGMMGVQFYDVIRSTVRNDFSGATCVPDTDGFNTSGADATVPGAGALFYYLVRAETDCGTGVRAGTLGYYTDGTERGTVPGPAPSCP